MSHTTATTPSEALYSFSLTHEQALNIATSLASDIGCAEDIMPSEFLLRHLELLQTFLNVLLPHEKSHVLGAISHKGAFHD
jgi:hypothetical protein